MLEKNIFKNVSSWSLKQRMRLVSNVSPGMRYTQVYYGIDVYILRILFIVYTYTWINIFFYTDGDRKTFKRVTHIDWRIDRSSRDSWGPQARNVNPSFLYIIYIWRHSVFSTTLQSLRAFCCCPRNYPTTIYRWNIRVVYLYTYIVTVGIYIYTDRWY